MYWLHALFNKKQIHICRVVKLHKWLALYLCHARQALHFTSLCQMSMKFVQDIPKTIRYINVIPTQNITYRIIINHANEHSSFAWLLYEYQSVFKLACQGINLSASMNTTHGILCNKKHRKHRNMMTSSNGNIFRVTGHLCGEFTGHRWIPHTKASVTELWCFLWSASE